MKNKQGISLIVLVITIIVMIILASAVVISLNNQGIISKANDAVELTNAKQVEQIVALAWSEAYIDGKRTKEELVDAVNKVLDIYEVDKDKYTIRVTTTGISVTDKIESYWTLEKTIADGKVTEAIVTNGAERINVGTVIDYMKDGVNGYKSGWKVLGADNKGRLLIMSMDSITGEDLTLKGKEGYKFVVTTLNTICAPYKDGIIGIDVRSINAEDINILTTYDKTTFRPGKVFEYANVVTYSWGTDEYPKYIYGSLTEPVSLTTSHKENGFTYFDVKTNDWVTSKYTGSANSITTLDATYYNYIASDYMDSTMPAYKMIFRNAADTADVGYWLASPYINTFTAEARFGVNPVFAGRVWYGDLFYSNGTEVEATRGVRAVVTLASDVVVELNETTGEAEIIN